MDDGKIWKQKSVRFGKVSGKHRFDVNANFTTKNWDINDLGFSTTTNIAIIMLGMDIEFYNQPKDSIIFI
jgi:hypothetical protein